MGWGRGWNYTEGKGRGREYNEEEMCQIASGGTLGLRYVEIRGNFNENLLVVLKVNVLCWKVVEK